MRMKIGMILALLLATVPLLAQNRFQAGGSLVVVSPQDAFRDNVDNVGGGFSGFFAYRLAETSPVLLGFNLGYHIYGINSWDEPLLGGLVYVDVTTTNALVNGLGMLRMQSPEGAYRPYLDAYLGFNYLTTDTEISDDDDGDEIASSKNHDDITHAYGAGGGVMILLKRAERPGQPDTEICLDLGFRYLKGGEAEYLKKDSIYLNDAHDEYYYDLKKSTTTVITFHLGVSVDF